MQRNLDSLSKHWKIYILTHWSKQICFSFLLAIKAHQAFEWHSKVDGSTVVASMCVCMFVIILCIKRDEMNAYSSDGYGFDVIFFVFCCCVCFFFEFWVFRVNCMMSFMSLCLFWRHSWNKNVHSLSFIMLSGWK